MKNILGCICQKEVKFFDTARHGQTCSQRSAGDGRATENLIFTNNRELHPTRYKEENVFDIRQERR